MRVGLIGDEAVHGLDHPVGDTAMQIMRDDDGNGRTDDRTDAQGERAVIVVVGRG